MVEQELSRTLHDRAEAAGPVPGDLSTILSTARRRRRRRTIVPAVAIVLAVALVSGVGIAWRDRSPSTVGPPSATLSPEPLGPAVSQVAVPAGNERVRSADEVWPGAVIHMASHEPGGDRINPVAMVDQTHLLVAASPAFELVTALRMYDTETRKFSAVTDLDPIGDLHNYYPQDFTTDNRTVVWYADGVDSDGHNVTQFLAADLAGGHKRLLASVRGSLTATELELVDHRYAVYSDPRHGGVYRIPLAGGTPRKLAGTSGMYLAAWPWVTNTGGFGGAAEQTTATLRNLDTGTTYTFRASGVRFLDCVPTLCVGDKTDGSTVVATPASSTAAPHFVYGGSRFALNRFVDAAYEDGSNHHGGALPDMVWDLKTGKVGTYKVSGASLEFTHHSGMVAWDDPDHSGQQMVLDLAAIK